MSEQQPEKPAIDNSPRAIAGAAAMVALYGVLATALICISGYFLLIQKLAITEPRVWVGLVGAAYLALRGVMIFNKRAPKKTDHAG